MELVYTRDLKSRAHWACGFESRISYHYRKNMNTVIKYVFICVTLYFGTNWIADNPKKFDQLRKQMNELVETGFEEATDFLGQ